jgi:hypothetical protein
MLTWKRALAWRMVRHHLVERASPGDLVRVAGAIGGLHAQVSSSAELSLWARIDGLSRDAVREALWTDRTLVKLWAARGTLYLLPADELGMWLSALGTSPKFHNAGHPYMDDFAGAVGRAVHGRVLTREELASRVVELTGDATHGEWIGSSWGSYLKAASFRGLICFGPGDGTRVTFTSPQTWAPFERMDPTDAVRQVVRRFLSAYAPAEPEDLTRWWYGPPQPRVGAKLLATLGAEAAPVTVDGRDAWALAADVPGLAGAAARDVARLLPSFDPWVIGAARHAPLLDPAHVTAVFRPQGWVSPVILVNGRIAGTWRHERRAGRLDVELTPFAPLPRWALAQLRAEAGRLSEFLDAAPGAVTA